MAAPRHGLPFIWPSWITGILAGSDSCEFAAWLQAHHQIQKVDRGFDLVAWTAEHGAMVREGAEQLRADGYLVHVEDQNKFFLKGRAAVLSGKPDIVALRGSDTTRNAERLVVDVKTGKEADAHVWQVLVYMFALPLVGHPLVPAGSELVGEVQYRHRSIRLDPVEFTPSMREQIVSVIQRVGQLEPLRKVPSARECGFCPVPKAECPERIEREEAVATTAAF